MYTADQFDPQRVAHIAQEREGWAEQYCPEICPESLSVRVVCRWQPAEDSLGQVGTQAADHTAQALAGTVAVVGVGTAVVAGMGTAVVAVVGTVVLVGREGTVRTEPGNVRRSAEGPPSRYVERPPDIDQRRSSGRQVVKQELDVDLRSCSLDKAGTGIADTVLADTVIVQAGDEEDYHLMPRWAYLLDTAEDLHMPRAAALPVTGEDTQLAAVEAGEHYIPLEAGLLEVLNKAVG